MARLNERFDEHRHGRLSLEEIGPDLVKVYYFPSPEKLEQSGLDQGSGSDHRVKLLKFDGIVQSITIFPTKTRGGREDFLQPKYNQIKRITLAYGETVLYPIDSNVHSGSDGFFLSPCYGPTEFAEKNDMDPDSLRLVPSTQEEVMMVLDGLPSAFIKDYDWGIGSGEKIQVHCRCSRETLRLH